MRASSSAGALALLFVFPFACAVYQDDALKALDGAAGAAGSTSTSATSGAAGANAVEPGSANQPTGGSNGTSASPAGGVAGGGNAGGNGGSSAQGGDGAGGAETELPAGGTDGQGGAPAKAGAGGGGRGGQGGALDGAGAGGGGAAGHAGSAGSGGQSNAPTCSDHPLTPRASWLASASHYDAKNGGVPANLLDNQITRWSTGKAQAGDEWLQIDFGSKVTLNHVNLQQGDDTNDYPRGYSVIVSDTGQNLKGPIALTGSGKSGVSTAILLPALATGRYLLIKQTGSSLSWWSAEEVEISCSE